MTSLDTPSLDDFTAIVSDHREQVGERRKGWLQPGYEGGRDAQRNKTDAKTNEDEAAATVEAWINGLQPREGKDLASELNELRRRTEELYDRTIAYITVHALVQGASHRLQTAARAVPGTPDATRLNAISSLFELIDLDAKIFQAVNRSDPAAAVAGVSEARRAAAGICSDLEGLDDDLAKELRAEATILEIYYRGLWTGACAVETEERAERAVEAGASPFDSAACLTAANQVSLCIEEIRNVLAVAGDGAPTALPGVVESCCSRLSAWIDVLDTMAKACGAYDDVLRVSRVELVYCYPFAVKLDPDLRKRGDDQLRDAALGRPEGETLKGIQTGLRELCELGDAEPRIEPLTRSELWAGSGDVVYNGASFALGTLRECAEPAGNGGSRTSEPQARLEAHLKLSLLGNHCLCLERTLENPSPSELFRALRDGTDYALDLHYRYGLEVSGGAGALPRWRNIHGFACDVIAVAAEQLSASDQVVYRRGDVHVIGVLTLSDRLDRDPTEMADKLDRLYGGRILRTNFHRVASALHEWTRYPITPDAALKVSEFGYRDDWLATTDDATLFLVTGNPTWRTEAYAEAAQFAASCSAQLLLWSRELFQGLDPPPEERPDSGDRVHQMRLLQLDAQKFTSGISSQALCWSRTHRRLVDELLVTTGTQAITIDLEARMTALELKLDKQDQERRQQDQERRERADTTRNVLLFILAIFGVFSLAGALELRTTYDKDVQWSLFWLMLVVVVYVVLNRGQMPRRLKPLAKWLQELGGHRADDEEPR